LRTETHRSTKKRTLFVNHSSTDRSPKTVACVAHKTFAGLAAPFIETFLSYTVPVSRHICALNNTLDSLCGVLQRERVSGIRGLGRGRVERGLKRDSLRGLSV